MGFGTSLRNNNAHGWVLFVIVTIDGCVYNKWRCTLQNWILRRLARSPVWWITSLRLLYADGNLELKRMKQKIYTLNTNSHTKYWNMVHCTYMVLEHSILERFWRVFRLFVRSNRNRWWKDPGRLARLNVRWALREPAAACDTVRIYWLAVGWQLVLLLISHLRTPLCRCYRWCESNRNNNRCYDFVVDANTWACQRATYPRNRSSTSTGLNGNPCKWHEAPTAGFDHRYWTQNTPDMRSRALVWSAFFPSTNRIGHKRSKNCRENSYTRSDHRSSLHFWSVCPPAYNVVYTQFWKMFITMTDSILMFVRRTVKVRQS